MDEKRVRVRLKFQEPEEILTCQQMEQGLAQSWYLVLLENVHTVADIAFDIRAAFHLEEACPNGLNLEVDGFVLPPSQPARLLKDSDLIRIKRRTDVQGHSNGGRTIYDHTPSKEWLASGLQRHIGYHGVQLRALDEFEKETGGYESEQEEGEVETDISLDGGLPTVKETSPLPTYRKEKNRSGKLLKRSNPVVSEVSKLRRPEELEAEQELAVVQVKDKGNLVLNGGGTQSVGIGANALDELEKETGNDEEKNGDVTLLSSEEKGSQKKVEAASQSNLSKQEKRERKRKRKEANIERHSQGPQEGEKGPSGSGVQCTVGEHANDGEKKVKRKKVKHSGSSPVGAAVKSTETTDQLELKLVEADCEEGPKEGTTSSGKKKRKKDSNSMNKDHEVKEGVLKKGAAVDKVRGKKRRKEAELDSPAEKLRTPKSKADGESIPAGTPKKNETISPSQEQRPSRSARRKKAKRQWLREQAKIALLTGVETSVPEGNRSADVQIAGEGSDGPPSGEELPEEEAEEEVLPIVVRAGHIRFEPLDKDEQADQSRSSMPELLLGDQVKTKRQGQNWGQEKGQGWATETDNAQYLEARGDTMAKNKRSEDPTDAASFEKHPALVGAPQEGDVLAYRLVELTASWTPEISEYRVGMVSHWEQSTNMIRVDPDPDYPYPGTVETDPFEDEVDRRAQEMEIVGPYDENGVLEIEFSSLVEVRLMHRVHSVNDEIVPAAPSVEIAKDLDPTTEGAPQVDNSTDEPVADVGHGAPSGEQQGVEDGERAGEAVAWDALLSEELEMKKIELSQREIPVENASAGSSAPSSEDLEKATGGSDGGGGKVAHQPKTGRSRKYKFLKSAGVGSIVALLRAEHAL